QTELQMLSTALVLEVQLIPSGEVITLLPVPLFDTATSKPSSVDQLTDIQLFVGLILKVQLIPSGEVITRPPAPVLATATSKPNCGDQQTEL
ncbi:hypothetical protein, partial [Leptospira biflexa]|uniref:hypothetical protein n=1 Tax=Leptospira biflexa TaxID=172 RepID=UPI001AEFD48D